MRRFNPEKELNKIRNGNKNKLIIGIITLLLIITIGSTYALYQVRHTNKLVFNTVGEFKKKDIIISVKLDDKEESVDNFPQKEDGYVYSHMECENNNITNITWDEEHWKLNADINGQDKCTVYFVKNPFHMKSCENKSMSECLLEEGQKFSNFLAFDDPDSNARYMGEDPENYIWFNCDVEDYADLTQETAKEKCEKWRIIGSFKDITIVDDKVDTDTPTKEKMLKVIRADKIGDIAWNIEEKNDWTDASLQKGLNGPYLLGVDNGDWITAPEYTGTRESNVKNANYKGITSQTQEMIEEVVWNIGGSSTISLNTSEWYQYEHGAASYNSQQTIWKGKIGLMYPSDYGYATSGGTTGRNECLNQYLTDWSCGGWNKPYTQCALNSWIWNSSANIWTLVSRSDVSTYPYYVGGWGNITSDSPMRAQRFMVYPTLYLKSSVKILSGAGTEENPYTIAIQ